MSRTALIESIGIRVVSVAIAAWLAMSLSQDLMMMALIVLGQGHFLLAYLYQAEGGHLPLKKLLILAVLLALLVAGSFFLPLAVASFLTGVGFLLHFSIDEARLLNGKHSLFTTLEATPFIVMYSAILGKAYVGFDVLIPAAIVSGLALLLYVVLALRARRVPNETTIAFAAWAVLTIVLYFLIGADSYREALVWFWGLVVVHYAIWYGVYWFKLKARPLRRLEYVLRVLLINLVLVLLAVIWIAQYAPILALLFAPMAFNIWTFMHGFASVRLSELRASFESA